MFVSCVFFCVCCVSVSASSLTLVQSSLTGCCVCVCLVACDLEGSTRIQPKPDMGCCATEQTILKLTCILYGTHISLCDSEELPRFCGRLR